jgi:hypothetical protein
VKRGYDERVPGVELGEVYSFCQATLVSASEVDARFEITAG